MSGDDELLAAAAGDVEAFAAFYRRHVAALLAYCLRRSGDPEVAADLCAETFAAALDGVRRFDPDRGPAVAWLYGIAHRQLGRLWERGAVDARARRRLGMERLQLTDEAIERVETLVALDSTAAALRAALDALPAEQRAAVEARVVEETPYADIASATLVHEATVRQRLAGPGRASARGWTGERRDDRRLGDGPRAPAADRVPVGLGWSRSGARAGPAARWRSPWPCSRSSSWRERC